MRNRHRSFLAIFREQNPLGTDSFRALRDQIADGGDGSALREFLVALNRELASGLQAENGADVNWAADLCLALVEANPELTVAALGNLLKDAALEFHDPLVAVAFEAASDAPAFLALLADIVETETQLLQFRVRAVEALVTKSPGDADARPVGLDAQPTLRFLNSVLEELEKGLQSRVEDSYPRWAEGLSALSWPFPAGEEPQVVEWVAEALGRLAVAPTARETMRLVLRILRANTPLPSWHPAAGLSGAGQGSGGSVSALIVDKAIQVVLSAAGARWRAEARGPVARPPRPGIELWPFNERVLEAVLVDAARPPRVRIMAAGLLRVLAHASPSMRLSRRAELYSELFRVPPRREARSEPPPADRLPGLDSEERLDLLLEALGDDCECIRRAALEACYGAALRHPAGFQPRHYTKLLPLLSADDPGIRVGTMRTFQALAGFRTRRVAAVVDDISARLHDEGDGDEEGERARRDLETALGITMDRLVDDVEQLQREVQALEARRRELLEYIERQAMRVGEEIHHEVLNTLTGYLATAIDEREYGEAKSRLDNLVAELRRIMNNLYPRDLETEGFLQTIRNRLRDARAQMERRTPGCTVELQCPPEITDATIAERWPSAEIFTASAPEDAVRIAQEKRIENLIFDLDFGAQRDSGVAIARKILEARQRDPVRTRILFRTVHAGDPGYLHQVQKLVSADKRYGPAVWGFLDKGSVPKRLAQNTVEQVFVYEVSFTEMFSQQLKNSPSRDLSDLEFTVLIYLCLGVTNDGVGWLIGSSRQSVERILGGLYRKLKIPSRRGAPQGVPTLLESRTRLCCEATIKGLVNPHLLREEDAELRQLVRTRIPLSDRVHVSPEWLEGDG